MVLLYYLLKNPSLPTDKISSVCADVEMSIEVFTAMGHHRVAKRCLELVTEVYELAKKAIKESAGGEFAANLGGNFGMEDESEFFANLIDPFLLEDYAFNEPKLDGLTPGVWNAPLPNEGMESGNALELFLNFSANRS